MKIYPQDLRPSLHAEIIQRRAHAGMTTEQQNIYAMETKKPEMGFLGRLWSKGADMTPEQAAVGLPAAAIQTKASIYAPPIFGAIISVLIAGISVAKGRVSPEVAWSVAAAATGLIGYLGAFPIGKATFLGLYARPVSVSELENLLSLTEIDAVEKAYFTLLRDAIRQEVTPDAERRLRETIQTLGASLDRLPLVTITPQDTAALRNDAARLRQEGIVQTDRVLSQSLERRAEAVERRAILNERSTLYATRQAALRAEIIDQIEALREGIVAFHTGAADTLSLDTLAEAAHRLAAETVAAAEARQELDAAPSLSAPLTALRVAPQETESVLAGKG